MGGNLEGEEGVEKKLFWTEKNKHRYFYLYKNIKKKLIFSIFYNICIQRFAMPITILRTDSYDRYCIHRMYFSLTFEQSNSFSFPSSPVAFSSFPSSPPFFSLCRFFYFTFAFSFAFTIYICFPTVSSFILVFHLFSCLRVSISFRWNCHFFVTQQKTSYQWMHGVAVEVCFFFFIDVMILWIWIVW